MLRSRLRSRPLSFPRLQRISRRWHTESKPSDAAKNEQSIPAAPEHPPPPSPTNTTPSEQGHSSNPNKHTFNSNLSFQKTFLSIPGPTWLWEHVSPAVRMPFRIYNSAQSRRPYLTQIASSLVIYFLGDLSAQYIQRPIPDLPDPDEAAAPPPPAEDRAKTPSAKDTTETPSTPASVSSFAERYDPVRSLRALIIGAIFSIPSYHWFLHLSYNYNIRARPYASLVLKIGISQALFSPLFNCYFFGMQGLLSGASWDEIKERLWTTVPVSWINSWKFWPIVTALSFTFVRPQSRSVAAGLAAVLWQSYLGVLNQRAAEAEVLERRRAVAG